MAQERHAGLDLSGLAIDTIEFAGGTIMIILNIRNAQILRIIA